MLLSRIEAELDNIPQARKYSEEAKYLYKEYPVVRPVKNSKKMFSELESYIGYREQLIEWKAVRKIAPTVLHNLMKGNKKTPQTQKPVTSEKSIKKPANLENADLQVQQQVIPSFSIPVKIKPFEEESFSHLLKSDISSLKQCRLFIDYTHLTLQGGFDELLCLNAIRDIEKYWYQIETVKKVLRYFHGRVLLCDEVGLGKTIEAGMLIKEYVIRGWKLVNQIKKRFIFLLTATPVQNNLIELFNLITLLKPGQFKTERIFKQEYLQKGNLRAPVNRERLKDMLRDVMIRNTRSAIDIRLPKLKTSSSGIEYVMRPSAAICPQEKRIQR